MNFITPVDLFDSEIGVLVLAFEGGLDLTNNIAHFELRFRSFFFGAGFLGCWFVRVVSTIGSIEGGNAFVGVAKLRPTSV
jgi:hypothetical protein